MMNTDSHRQLPEDPTKRRVIIILDDHSLSKCENGGEDFLTIEGTYPMSISAGQADNSHDSMVKMRNAGLIESGRILVQSPFDNSEYIDWTDAEVKFALAKHLYFSQFCGLLGAQLVEASSAKIRSRKSEKRLGSKLKGWMSSVDGELRDKREEQFRSKLRVRTEFKGSPPQMEEASSLLDRTGLRNDLEIRSLLDICSQKNEVISHTLDLDYSAENESSLAVASKVKLPDSLEMQCNYEETLKQRYTYEWRATVAF